MSDPGRILIIGAGPAGLGAAYRLQELGYPDFRVLEAKAYPGGLAASYLDEAGYTWDVGGHVQHSHYPYYDRVLDQVLGDRRFYHERESWVWIKGRFVPYPFQYNLHHLDPEDCAAALRGLERVQTEGGDTPPHFGAWIDATFGDAIGRLFLRPYNEKVWGYPLERLSAAWIRDRVAVPDLGRIRRNVESGCDDVSWGPNNRFFYPAEGGTGAIWHGVAAQLPPDRLAFSVTVASIDLAGRRLILEDGTSLEYGSLISSMPLDLLCARCRGLDADTMHAAATLVHSSCHIIGIGIQGAKPQTLSRKCWMYFPEAEVPYYRLTVLSNYSPHNVPPGEGFWSLMAEVCETPHWPVDHETIVADCITRLRADGLIPAAATVVSRWHRREEYGYPTPFLHYEKVVPRIRTRLERDGVYSRGRFGAWQYEVSNQDHSFMQGVEVVNRLLQSGEDATLQDPNRVNRR